MRAIYLLFFMVMAQTAFALAPAQLPMPPTASDIADESALRSYLTKMSDYLATPDNSDPNLNQSNAREFNRLKSYGTSSYRQTCINGVCTVYYHINDKGYAGGGALTIVQSASEKGKAFLLKEVNKMYQAVVNRQYIHRMDPQVVISGFGFYGKPTECMPQNQLAGCEFVVEKI